MSDIKLDASGWEQFSKKRIIGLAIERQISLRRISIELDKSATYVQNIVGSKNRNVSLRNFLEILEILDVTPREFFDPNFKNISLIKQATDMLNQLPENEIKMLMQFMVKIK